MQQEKHPKTSNKDNASVQQGEKFQPPSLTAICVWLFVIFSVVFWAFLRKQIPVQSEYIKVGVESMFNIALLILVVVQTRLYFKQTKAMDAQISATERNTIYEQRAYVYAKIGDVREDIFDVVLLIENSGNSPAVNVKLSYSAGFRRALPHRITGDWDKFHAGYPIGVLPPKIHYPHTIYNRPAPKPEELRTYYGRGSTYHVWGEITYQDVFGNQWYTSFNFRIIATSIAKINIFPEVVGNEAT
jgi:hypothetical protein